jgi:hypothetical protein
MFLVNVGWYCGKNESNIHSTVLNFMHLAHPCFFFNNTNLRAICLLIPRVYYPRNGKSRDADFILIEMAKKTLPEKERER